MEKENGGKIKAKNKSEKKVAKKAESNPEQPYVFKLGRIQGDFIFDIKNKTR